MAKKNYVLDTSVCLTDADVLFKFDNHYIFLPLKVLEEMETKLKELKQPKDLLKQRKLE